MLAQQAAELALVLARYVGHGIEHDIGAVVSDDDQAETETAAELANVLELLGPLADREIDLVAQRQAVDALQHQPESEDTLELDDDRRLAAAHSDHVAGFHFAA